MLIKKIREKLEFTRSELEMLNGTDWEDFKAIINAQFKLFSITGDLELLKCFVSRMKNPVKGFCAKFAYNRQVYIYIVFFLQEISLNFHFKLKKMWHIHA